MDKLIDKIIIYIFCIALYIFFINDKYMIITILIALTFSAALSYLDYENIKLVLFLIYLIICIVYSQFIFFIPLICHDAFSFKFKFVWVLSFIPLIINMNYETLYLYIIIFSFILVSCLLKYRTSSLLNIKKEYYVLQDYTKEEAILLENKNKELMEKQYYEINLATLKERNRIARDIHDNVGHMLSRALLQIGALLVINKDENSKESLLLIKDTLSLAMDSIRSSVHDLHDEACNLQAEIQALIKSFSFCEVEFDYSIETNLEKDIKYCFISIVKEALSNIIKHSNATWASIIMSEHPAFYQLIIKDNGTKGSYKSDNGIGLKGVKERVSYLEGIVNISFEKGFKIFISIPKK